MAGPCEKCRKRGTEKCRGRRCRPLKDWEKHHRRENMNRNERKQLEDAGLLYREVSPIYAIDVGALKAALEEEARRPRGRWEIHEDANWAGGGYTKCSACGYCYSWGGFSFVDEWPFCSHCGTPMEAEP